jgi:hypothetical protein
MRKTTLFLTFLAACTDGTTFAPPVAPVDRAPPRLEVVSPQRGLIRPGAPGTVEVRGFARDAEGDVRVRVNGVPATVSRIDGAFVAEVPLREGMTFLHTVATDAAGNTAGDTRAALAGALVSADTPVDDGIVARLDARAIRAGGELLAGRLAGGDLTARVENPLYENPIPCLSARAEVTRLAHGKVIIGLTPVDGGLSIDATVEGIEVGLRVAHATSCSAKTSLDVTGAAPRFRLAGLLRLGVDGDGLVAVDRQQADAWVEGFRVEGELPRRVVDQVEAAVAEALATLYAEHLGGHVPSVILRGLGAGDRRVAVGGGELELALRPTRLAIDFAGVAIAVDTQVSLPPASAGGVFLASGAPSPALVADDPLAVGISDDAMNQLVASLWGAGAFDGSLATAAGIAPVAVNPAFDAIELAPRLPPVLTALPGGSGARVALGDVEVAFLRGAETVARVSVSAELSVAVTASGDRLRLTPLHRQVWTSPLHDNLVEPRAFAGDDLDRAGFWASERIVELLEDRVAHLPLPAARGEMFAAGTVYGTQPVEGYVVIRGDVAP